MKKRPDRLFAEKDQLNNFKLLKNEKDSPLYGKAYKDIFIMAMLVGVKNGSRIPLKNKEEITREEYLNDDDKSIIKAISVNAEENLTVLLNWEKIYQIAEEYALGGIKSLVDSIYGKQHGSYISKLETELFDICENSNIV